MKRAVRIAWSFSFTFLVTAVLFFVVIAPARAPQGGKNSLGGRTIASLQEEDFDKKILRYQLCQGVRFYADTATLERRRVCKAMLVHEMEAFLGASGAYLRTPVEFHCQDTSIGKKEWENGEGQPAVALQPNFEEQEMEKVLAASVDHKIVSEEEDKFARDACEFLSECKEAMRPKTLSFRHLGHCLMTENITHRKILLDEIASMLFRVELSSKILYADLLDEARN